MGGNSLGILEKYFPLGLARVNSVCQPEFDGYTWMEKPAIYSKQSVNDYVESDAIFGTLAAHELGHNLGFQHDEEGDKKCWSENNVMYPAVSKCHLNSE